ncbi:pectinesterase family protein [Undibacterium sp. Ji50W]|uniref:pectinesterase family protein n=1 Tax=Undibacterium sp. Ji50W TaxID=3413041 RepID=UPI003BF456DE
MKDKNSAWKIALTVALFLSSAASHAITKVTVGGTGAGHYTTIQAAVEALPSNGGEIDVTAGTYTEQVTITKPNVRLIGQGAHATSTIITQSYWAQKSNGSGGTVGDKGSSTVIVTGAGFFANNITIQNTYTQDGHTETQALALFLASDKSVLRNVHLIGRQDTLYVGSLGCSSTTCTPARSYFYGVTIEGNVDFIFGDGAAVFDNCVIVADQHGSLGGEVTITAQNRHFTNYLSGYVFYNSTISSNPQTGLTAAYLGRPWGALASNIFINTNIQAPINAAGMIEFTPGSTNNLPTSYFAEYGSSGPGAAGFTAKKREKYTVYLTSSQTTQYQPNNFLAGSDAWVPTSVF